MSEIILGHLSGDNMSGAFLLGAIGRQAFSGDYFDGVVVQ